MFSPTHVAMHVPPLQSLPFEQEAPALLPFLHFFRSACDVQRCWFFAYPSSGFVRHASWGTPPQTQPYSSGGVDGEALGNAVGAGVTAVGLRVRRVVGRAYASPGA